MTQREYKAEPGQHALFSHTFKNSESVYPSWGEPQLKAFLEVAEGPTGLEVGLIIQILIHNHLNQLTYRPGELQLTLDTESFPELEEIKTLAQLLLFIRTEIMTGVAFHTLCHMLGFYPEEDAQEFRPTPEVPPSSQEGVMTQ